MNETRTRTASIFLDEDGILNIVMHPRVKVDYEDALDNYLAARHISGNTKVLKLIHSKVQWSIDKKAKDFLNRKEVADQTIARAILKGSAFSKMLETFFVSVSKPSIPVKVFTDEEEAREWLLSMRESAR